MWSRGPSRPHRSRRYGLSLDLNLIAPIRIPSRIMSGVLYCYWIPLIYPPSPIILSVKATISTDAAVALFKSEQVDIFSPLDLACTVQLPDLVAITALASLL